MLVHIPDHFSSSFIFDFSKCPTSKTDRSSVLKSLIKIVCGFCLLILGGFELLSFIKSGGQNLESIFAIIIILLALSIIISSFSSITRYKKFYFDGKKFDITYKSSLSASYFASVPLEEYEGVRLRILFAQNGIINKYKYIIDLYHKDNNKIVPLYISKYRSNLIKIWYEYAKALGLPALSINERGVVRRECVDLEKNLRELSLENKLPFIASGKLPAPKFINVIENKLSTLVKSVGVHPDSCTYWSIFVLVLSVTVLISSVVLLFKNNTMPSSGIGALYILLISVIIYSLLSIFSTTQYEISKNSISLKLYFSKHLLRERVIDMNNIKNVELSYSPVTGRYGIAIIENDEIYLIEEKLPASDVLWLKDFLIRKIVGN